MGRGPMEKQPRRRRHLASGQPPAPIRNIEVGQMKGGTASTRPSGLRTHALDSHVAKLGVLLTFFVSRLPLRVIPPFL